MPVPTILVIAVAFKISRARRSVKLSRWRLASEFLGRRGGSGATRRCIASAFTLFLLRRAASLAFRGRRSSFTFSFFALAFSFLAFSLS